MPLKAKSVLGAQIEQEAACVKLAAEAGMASDATDSDIAELDHAFSRLQALLAPRIRHLINLYHMTDMLDDAEQACAIAIWRALQSYDAALASFATHVTWQLRGELQSLRHRVRLDQRRSARNAGLTTVAIDALADAGAVNFEIVDDQALQRTEAEASNAMAATALDRMLDAIGSPEYERRILHDHLFDHEQANDAYGYTREQRRQIRRRTWRNCAKIIDALRAIE